MLYLDSVCYNCSRNCVKIWKSNMSWLKMSVIKTEAHINVTEPEYQDNALVDLHTKAATTTSIKTVAHVDDVYSASAEMTPQCQT